MDRRSMKRRDLMGLAGAMVFAGAGVARAQQADTRRIGVLMSTAETDPESRTRIAAFVQHLRTAGWVDGRSARFDYRWAGGNMDRINAYAKELVDLRPDVIFVLGPAGALALRRETRTVPIVFVLVSDPAGRGIVSNLAKPGGNVTGFTNIEPTAAGKWVEILREMAPRVTRAAVVFDPVTTPGGGLYMAPLEAAASRLGVATIASPIKGAADIEAMALALGREPGGGFVVLPNPVTEVHRKAIVDAAARHRLPAVYPYPHYAADGGLVSYGTDASDVFRRGGEYVVRILRGEKAGDLPVQQPIKFQLVINLAAAKALGLTVSPALKARADEVIE